MPVYLGNVVPTENFRVFIYSPTEESKLVESWHEFEVHMQTGVWFATKEEAEEIKEQKIKRKKKLEAEETQEIKDKEEVKEVKKDKK